MIAALLALAGAAAIAYGWVANLPAAMTAGIVLVFGAVVLRELAVLARVRAASDELAAFDARHRTDLLDFSDVDWSGWDDRDAA